MTTVEVLGAPRSPSARRIVELLRRNAVPYRWRNTDEDPSARALVEEHRFADGSRPFLVVVPGDVLVDPDEPRVRDALGLAEESPAAAFRAFAAAVTDTVVVGRGSGDDIVVIAQDTPDGAVCTSVHGNQLWIAAGATRLLALHRLVTRVRTGDANFGADRGYGPAAPRLDQLEANAHVFTTTVSN